MLSADKLAQFPVFQRIVTLLYTDDDADSDVASILIRTCVSILSHRFV